MRGTVINEIVDLLKCCDYDTLVAVRNVIKSLLEKGA